jgi:hypothetical protein
VGEAMSEAIDTVGSFEPPIVVAGGMLRFPFDGVATLEATLAAVAPFLLADGDLERVVSAVAELARAPWLRNAGDAATTLVERVREACGRVDPLVLDGRVERILLEQRAYQRRTILGGRFIRALLAPTGGGAMVPCYLPEALGDLLPLARSLLVRMVAEAHVRQDEADPHDAALKVLALGRVVQV